jgi:pectate lyase-like protein
MVDVPFTSYAFKPFVSGVTDTSVARSMPTRLSEVVNVKDWGAKGDGTTDDTAAIYNAIKFANLGAGAFGGAVVFFPPGDYLIGTPPLICDPEDGYFSTNVGRRPIMFVGAGRSVTRIIGNYYTGNATDSTNNSFLLRCGRTTQQGNGTCSGFRDMSIWNLSTGNMSGPLINEASGNRFHLENVHFKGVIGLNHSAANNFGSCYRNCLFECTRPITRADAAVLSPLYDKNKVVQPTGGQGDPTYVSNFSLSIGLACSQSTVIGCQFVGFDVGCAAWFLSPVILGCTAYRCGIGILPGFGAGSPRGTQGVGGVNLPDPGGYFQNSGSNICANKIDRCTWGISMGNISGLLAANAISGQRCGDQAIASPYDPVPIQSMSWNSSTHVVTVTMAAAHNINIASAPKLQLAWAPASSAWTIDPYGVVPVTGGTSNTFTYAGPATDPGSFTTGTWNFPLEYGLCYIGSMPNTTIAAIAMDYAEASIASFSLIEQNSQSARDIFRSTAMCIRGGRAWIASPFTVVNGNIVYHQCGTAGAGLNPSQFVTFSELPGQVNADFNFEQAIEGMERTIIDAQAQASFRGIVSGGGGSNHYKVRYDGSNWIRVG